MRNDASSRGTEWKGAEGMKIAPSVLHGATALVLFFLFFLSGFCSLLYQVIWVRMAFASFGVITPVLSVVLSVFMLGLGLGSIFGGRVARAWDRSHQTSLAVVYGFCELAIGIGALSVPFLFSQGDQALLQAGEMSSIRYLLLSALVIAASILPWCVMMGATFPLMMGFIRQTSAAEESSFSFLYVANVIGAMTGTALTALVLVEVFGFRRTTQIGAVTNFLIALISFALAGLVRRRGQNAIFEPSEFKRARRDRWIEIVLFTTGFASLAMEVVWTRAFTFVLKTTIYSFAAVLTTYLLATWIGSYCYRYHRSRNRLIPMDLTLALACLFALVPVIVGDPRFDRRAIFVLASIAPFCLVLGYLTPRLVDEYSRGTPAEAGRCYAINILGCILGPLVSAYILLPYVGVRGAFLVLCIPLFLLFLWAARGRLTKPLAVAVMIGFAAMFGVSALISRVYEDGVLVSGPREIRRDHVASVIAYGTGMGKQLMVNGIAITYLTPVTKVMAHLPLAINGHAKAGLDICFGMGTTFRSMYYWGIQTSAVELSPSVVDSFGFFAPADRDIVRDHRVNIVIDDGRRYLLRSGKQFDVVTIDPPPPIEAAGSSLLYSTDFYEVVKAHLAPRGILQQWFPETGGASLYAAARSLREAFRYVVAFKSIEDSGYHFLASEAPIPELTPAEFVARLPETAKRDLMEWSPGITIETMAENILSGRAKIDDLLLRRADIRITDDRPYNEYYFLRKHGVLPK
jgi:predicted membrane-bound spermidine synthase